MTKEEIFESACEFIEYAGEDFYDYFADDNINTQSWAYFLLGKGYVEQATDILDSVLNLGFLSIGKQFHIYPERINKVYSEENQDKNLMLVAEFISLSPYYTEKFKEWTKDWKDAQNEEE